MSDLNRALLAYVVDAMTKALVIRTAPTQENPEGTLLARAILKLGTADSDGRSTLVLERAYATGGDVQEYEPLLERAARELAAIRGWRLAKIIDDGKLSSPPSHGNVTIAASQNRFQYEDGLHMSIEQADRGPYSMGVQFLS